MRTTYVYRGGKWTSKPPRADIVEMLPVSDHCAEVLEFMRWLEAQILHSMAPRRQEARDR